MDGHGYGLLSLAFLCGRGVQTGFTKSSAIYVLTEGGRFGESEESVRAKKN